MSIEALSGISAGGSMPAPQAVQADASTAIHEQDVSPSSEAADSFRDTLSKLHDEINQFHPNASQNSAHADPVAAAKADMLPSPWKGQAASTPDATPASMNATNPTSPTSGTSDNANTVLRKSFDHAVYITLVSQVVGGVSQAASTLIKQQ
jgi:hypothetical protein